MLYSHVKVYLWVPKWALNLGVFSSFSANKFPILQPPSWNPSWSPSVMLGLGTFTRVCFHRFCKLESWPKTREIISFFHPPTAIPNQPPEKPWEHCGQDFWWAGEKGITVKASEQARLVCQPLAPAHNGWTPCLLPKLNPFPLTRIYPVPVTLVPCQMLSYDSKNGDSIGI